MIGSPALVWDWIGEVGWNGLAKPKVFALSLPYKFHANIRFSHQKDRGGGGAHSLIEYFWGVFCLCEYYVILISPDFFVIPDILYQGIFSLASGILWLYAIQATLSKVYIGPLATLFGGLLLELGYALNSGRRYRVSNIVYFVIIPIIITIILLKVPSITYNPSIVFATKNWSTSVTITNYYNISPRTGEYCNAFTEGCPKQGYSVSGFYYVNSTAHNSTCWITKILLLRGNSTIDVTHDSIQASNVTSYMRNYDFSPFSTGCNPPGIITLNYEIVNT